MIFGLTQTPVELIPLANDDEATPIGLIGAKQVPILQKADGSHMGESLDIVRYIDAQAGDSRLQRRGCRLRVAVKNPLSGVVGIGFR